MEINHTNTKFEMPTVSIIIPAYNASLYLRECVDSVVNQDFKDWELILVDDGSTDETVTICREYASSASNISYHCQSNQGVSVARNRGLEMANGEFVMFIDADDLLPANSLTLFYKAYLVNKSVDLIRGEYDAVDGNGNWLFTSNKKVFDKTSLYCEDDINKFIGRYIKTEYFLWLMWIRRSLIDKTRFIKGRTYMEDAEFLFSIFSNVRQSVYIPRVIYNYRKHEAAASSSLNEKRLGDIVLLATHLAAIWKHSMTALSKDTVNYAIVNCWEMVFNYLLSIDSDSRFQIIESCNLRNKVSDCISIGFRSKDMIDFVKQDSDSFVMDFSQRQRRKAQWDRIRNVVSYIKSRF